MGVVEEEVEVGFWGCVSDEDVGWWVDVVVLGLVCIGVLKVVGEEVRIGSFVM